MTTTKKRKQHAVLPETDKYVRMERIGLSADASRTELTPYFNFLHCSQTPVHPKIKTISGLHSEDESLTESATSALRPKHSLASLGQ